MQKEGGLADRLCLNTRKKNKTMNKYTEKSLLADIMGDGKAEVLLTHGVPCIGCSMFGFELQYLELGAVAKTYGLNLEALLADLNA